MVIAPDFTSAAEMHVGSNPSSCTVQCYFIEQYCFLKMIHRVKGDYSKAVCYVRIVKDEMA